MTGFCERYPRTRYRKITRESVAASAQHCPICTVLDDGMAAFWASRCRPKNEDQKEVKEDENKAHGNKGDMPSTTKRPGGGLALCEENITLELRPGRSLCINRRDRQRQGHWKGLTKYLGRLEFSTDEDDQRPAFNPAFARGAVPLSCPNADSVAAILKRWLKLCDEHEQCSSHLQSRPKRHCWGNPANVKPLQTTKDSYNARIEGINWAELPTLFQDVITLLRKLGLCYLWIDSICIIQDDDGDWLEQSAQMAGVYSNSYLNLAAAAAKDSSQSLFEQRLQVFAGADNDAFGRPSGPSLHLEKWATHVIRSRDIASASILVRPHNQLGHNCVLGDETTGREAECPLLDRAWVYQERLLAPRTAFFSRSELMWQCREFSGCECRELDNHWNILPQAEAISEQNNLSSLDRQLESPCWEKRWFEKIRRNSGSPVATQNARNFWLLCVAQYSSMALTRESDRAHAIAGVALKIREVTNDRYLAGLWYQDLPRALTWASFPDLKSIKNATRHEGGIPTWSWISTHSGSHLSISYPFSHRFKADPRVRIIEEGTWCRTDGYQFGLTRFGQIELEAASLAAFIAVSEKSYTGFGVGIYGDDPGADMYLLLPDCPHDPSEPLRMGDSVLLILLGQNPMLNSPSRVFLVVKPAKHMQNAYRQVGIVAPSASILDDQVRAAPTSRFILV
ncbi:hypothetical protein FALCPG4_007142 [Fusarium falciforme]